MKEEIIGLKNAQHLLKNYGNFDKDSWQAEKALWAIQQAIDLYKDIKSSKER